MGHNTIISYKFEFDKCGVEFKVKEYSGCDGVNWEGTGKIYGNLRQH